MRLAVSVLATVLLIGACGNGDTTEAVPTGEPTAVPTSTTLAPAQGRLFTIEDWETTAKANGINWPGRSEVAASALGALRGFFYTTEDGIGIRVYEYEDAAAALKPTMFDQNPFVVNGNLKLYQTSGSRAGFGPLRDLFVAMP